MVQRIDVYKRQVFDCEEDAHAAVVNNEINPGEILVIRYEGPRGSGMPVSYTHLDVYKRQSRF